MSDDKYLLDVLFEKFKNVLPEHLQPHAFKIEVMLIFVGILAVLGYIYSWDNFLIILATFGLLYGVIAVLVFLRWLFTGKY